MNGEIKKKRLYDTHNPVDLSQRIKELRKKNKWSQHEVAQQIGFSRSMYARIETGCTTPFHYLDKLLAVFGNELLSDIPYDVYKYCNQRILIYMFLYNKNLRDISNAFGIENLSSLEKSLYDTKLNFYLNFKDEIDDLFPEMDSVKNYDGFKRIGKTSLEFVTDKKKAYVFVNALSRNNEDLEESILKKEVLRILKDRDKADKKK